VVFCDCCFLCVCLHYPTLIPLRRKSKMLFVLVVGFWATRSHAKDRVAAGQGIVVQCQVDYFVVQQLDLYGLVDNLSSP